MVYIQRVQWYDYEWFRFKLLPEITILNTLDAVSDYMNISDKWVYYIRPTMSEGMGHPKGCKETILNYLKISVYCSYCISIAWNTL